MEISQSLGSQQLGWDNNVTAIGGKNDIGSRPPPPPPPEDELSDYFSESEEQEASRDFLAQIMSMEDSGEFDATALAEQAPASMLQYAKENNIDLANALQQQHDKRTANQQAPIEGAPNMPRSLSEYSTMQQDQDPGTLLMNSLNTSIGVNTMA
jgi:hypothetical protein